MSPSPNAPETAALGTRFDPACSAYFEKLTPVIAETGLRLRQLILSASDELVESLKWGMPNYTYHGVCVYLQAAKAHINFGFHHGHKLLPFDTHHVLGGDGKALKYVQLRHPDEINSPVFTQLILHAMKLNHPGA